MSKWREVSIQDSASLLDSLKIIEKSPHKTAVVIDHFDKLVGTINDSDIRSHLIKGGAIKDPVLSACNFSPKTVQSNKKQSHGETSFSILIDQNNIVQGIVSPTQDTKRRDNPVFIMAGGFGTRLKPLTDSCPKPMLKIGNKPILHTIIESFTTAGFYKFYLSTHYLPHVIQEYFGDGQNFNCSIQYVHEETPLGTGGALSLLPKDLTELPIIMMNGDILTKVNYVDLLRHHNEQKNLATIGAIQHQYQIPYGVIKEENSCVIGIEEKPIQSYFVNGGIYVFEPRLTNAISANTKIDMPPLLMQQVALGEKVSLFPIHEYWLDIGQKEQFDQAMSDIKNLNI